MSRIATHSDNFPCVGCDETNFHLASTTWSSNFTSSTHPYDNLKTVASSTTYATINVDKTKSSTSYFYALFDFSSIPNRATITNTIGKIRLYSSGNYVSNRDIRWCIGDINTPLRTSQNYSTSSNPTAITLEPLQSGISVQDLNNVKCYVRYLRSTRNDNTQRYIYMYGADVTVDWEETLFEFTCNSSVQGVGMTSGETTSGGSYTATITGISNISSVVIKDNGVDVTSQFTKSGNNYVRTYSNVVADHAITIEAAATPSKKSYIKMAGAFVESSGFYQKSGNSWTLIEAINVWNKVNGNWLSGQTMTTSKTKLFFDKSYVLDNCVMNLDGIDSYAGRYTDTGMNTIVYPIGMTNNFMREVDVVADGTSFTFNGTTSYMRPSASADFDKFLYNTHTIEACFEVSSFDLSEGGAFTLFVGRNSKATVAMYAYYYQGNMYFIRSCYTSTKMLVVPALSTNQIYYIAANNNGWLFNGVYYSDADLTTSTNSVGTNDMEIVTGNGGPWACASIGMRFKDGKDPQALTGKIYAMRIHSSLLTEGEMRMNMSCDYSRYA